MATATPKKHKGRKGLGVLSNQGRKVTASNRASTAKVFAAPQNVLATPYNAHDSKTYANLHKELGKYKNGELVLGNFPGADKAANLEIAGLQRAQTPQARWGTVCPGCNVQLPRTGVCFTC